MSQSTPNINHLRYLVYRVLKDDRSTRDCVALFHDKLDAIEYANEFIVGDFTGYEIVERVI